MYVYVCVCVCACVCGETSCLVHVTSAADLEVVAVIVMVPVQGLDDEIVDREPDWPAPVGVAAKHGSV